MSLNTFCIFFTRIAEGNRGLRLFQERQLCLDMTVSILPRAERCKYQERISDLMTCKLIP